jgi:hypothetical protein
MLLQQFKECSDRLATLANCIYRIKRCCIHPDMTSAMQCY